MVLDDFQKLRAVAVEFGLADAVDGEEGFVCCRGGLGHVAEGGVAEDDVRRHALLAGEVAAEVAEFGEEVFVDRQVGVDA